MWEVDAYGLRCSMLNAATVKFLFFFLSSASYFFIFSIFSKQKYNLISMLMKNTTKNWAPQLDLANSSFDQIEC